MIKKLTLGILIVFAGSQLLHAQVNWKWTEVGRMPSSVSFAQAVVKDSLIYIIGGYSDSLKRWESKIQEYNPRTNKWRVVDSMVSRRGGFYADTYKDSIFMVGGSMQSGSVLRPTMEFWTGKAKPYVWRQSDLFVRNYTAGVRFQDRVFLIGGAQGGAKSALINHYFVEYNLKSSVSPYFYDSVFTPAYMPIEQMPVLVDSTIYIFGGAIGDFPILSTVFTFHVVNRSFKLLNQRLQEPQVEGAVVPIGRKRVLLIGGVSNDLLARPTTDIYTMNNLQFTQEAGPPLLQPRQSHVAVVYDSVVYVFGGRRLNNLHRYEQVATIEKLNFTTGVEDYNDQGTPSDYVLHDNYPNPFNPSTNISFTMVRSGTVQIQIFDILGRQIKELVHGNFGPGKHTVVWEAKDASGSDVASGVYLYRMQINNKIFTKKMLYVR